MKGAILQILILCAVIVTGYMAFYLKQPVEPVPSKIIPKEQPEPAKYPPRKKDFSPTFTLLIDPAQLSNFGILGEGRGEDLAKEGINSTILNQLFTQLKIRHVKAVFFTGNIVSGVEQGGKKDLKPISSQKLSEDLAQFSDLYKSVFEGGTPFYPALGDREIMIRQSGDVFIEKFHLQGAKILGDELLYTVSAGNAFFAVIGTDKFMDGRKNVEENFSDAMLQWLSKVLREGAKNHKYLFVMGYEPAFPSTSTFLKANLPQRDAFWKILVQNKVLAYFCSKEHLFDRSFRSGVWQIISGGGGAPMSRAGGSQPFFHALVLSIPAIEEETSDEKLSPNIQVIDTQGNVIEEFSLASDSQPLYQMRIP